MQASGGGRQTDGTLGVKKEEAKYLDFLDILLTAVVSVWRELAFVYLDVCACIFALKNLFYYYLSRTYYTTQHLQRK